MADPIRIGIIGCGGLTQAAHLPSLAVLEEFEVAAVCDVREEAAQRSARRLRGARPYSDYRRMLEEERLEAALVCAPPAVHEEAGIAVLERGLHLFTEKPPSMTAAGARRLADAAVGKPLVTMVGTMWRHAPAHGMAKELMAREEFGRPIHFAGRYVAPGPGMRMDWGLDRRSDDDMVRFFFLDHIVHLADATRFFMGDVAAVQAVRSRLGGECYAFQMNLEFASGVAGGWTLAFHGASFDAGVHILGDGPAWVQVRNWQRLEYGGPKPWAGRGGYNDFPAQSWDTGIGYSNGITRPGYKEELEAFARAVRAGEPVQPNLEDGWQAMRVIEALIESLQGSRRVAL